MNGFRLYLGDDGDLRLDQLVGGMVYPLEPSEEDQSKKLGYYDEDFKFKGITLNYDPDQPRDDDGKFGEGAGGGSESAPSEPAPKMWGGQVTQNHKAVAQSTLGRPLTQKEDYAFSYYAQDSRGFNGPLRSGTAMTGDYPEGLSRMDKVFKDASLSHDIEAFRSVSPELYAAISERVGGVFTDKGFVSTSASPNFIKEQAMGKGDTSVRVKMPKGSKALPIAHVAKGNFKGQAEILIDRDSTFKVGRDKKGLFIELQKK
jgi:hypothetical protein